MSIMTTFKSVMTATGWRGRGVDFALGAVTVLGLAPFHIWTLSLLTLAALCYRLRVIPPISAKPARAAFGRGFWFGLGYFLCGTYWIGSAFIARGPEFIPLMVPMVLGLAVLLSLFWGWAGWVFYKTRAKLALTPLVFAAAFTLAEILRGHIFTGFPWNLPGYIFEAGGAASQTASITGIYGLTFIVFLIAGLIAAAPPYKRVCGVIAGLILGAMILGGTLRLSGADVRTVPGVKLRLVQVDFDQSDQMSPDTSVAVVNRYLTHSVAPGIEDITHIIWPEGAVGGLAIENEALLSAMGQALTTADATPPIWILNSARHEQVPSPSGPRDRYYNTSAAVSFNAQGVPAVISYNDKAKLVPFGEFVPFSDFIKGLNIGTLSSAAASFTPAPAKLLSDLPGLPTLSTQICYEIIFPSLTPRPKNGPRAQWVLNQSNDGWYGASIGPHQHANQARYRAIEEGLPIIRSVANGLNGAIDPYGRWADGPPPALDDDGPRDTSLNQALTMPKFRPALTLYLALISLLICLFCRRWK